MHHLFRLSRKVDVRLPGKGNSNSHGARPVHLIIKMIKWIRTSRLSIKNSLSLPCKVTGMKGCPLCKVTGVKRRRFAPTAGSYLRLIDSCITQLKAQGHPRTCNESKEGEEEEEFRTYRAPHGGDKVAHERRLLQVHVVWVHICVWGFWG